jgi:hypothetical protein
VATFSCPAFAQQTTIDFDDQSGETDLQQDYYASLGVIFSSTTSAAGDAFIKGLLGFASVLDDPNGGAFSLPNILCGEASCGDSTIVATL